MALQYHNSKLKLSGFSYLKDQKATRPNVWPKNTVQLYISYAMPMGRTCDSVKPPLGNSVDLLQAWFIKFCLHLDRYKGNTLHMWTSFLQHQLKSCVATNRTAFNNYEVLVHTWWGVVLTTWLDSTAFSLWIHCVLGAWGVRTFHIQWMVKILHFPP